MNGFVSFDTIARNDAKDEFKIINGAKYKLATRSFDGELEYVSQFLEKYIICKKIIRICESNRRELFDYAFNEDSVEEFLQKFSTYINNKYLFFARFRKYYVMEYERTHSLDLYVKIDLINTIDDYLALEKQKTFLELFKEFAEKYKAESQKEKEETSIIVKKQDRESKTTEEQRQENQKKSNGNLTSVALGVVSFVLFCWALSVELPFFTLIW